MNRLSILSGIFLLTHLCAIGQLYPSRHFTTEDGLPSNTVYHIYRDSKGFLWACTDKGVARYNGIKFERFTTNDGLADNEVFIAIEDSLNRIWFGSYNGKLCYYKDDTFHNAENTPFLRLRSKHSFVARAFSEKDGSTSISFFDKGYFCNITENKCTEIQLTDKKGGNLPGTINYIEKVNSHIYTVVLSDTIVTVDITSSPNIVKKEKIHLEDSARILSGDLWCSRLAQNQKWVFYFTGGYSIANFKNAKEYPRGLGILSPNHLLRIIHTDPLGNVFYTTDHGIYVNDIVRLLAGENVSFMTQDVNDNYWASTVGNGIFCFSKNFASSRVYPQAYSGPVSFATEVNSKLFFSIGEDNLYQLQNGKSVCLFAPKYNKADQVWLTGSGKFLDTNFTYYHFRGHHNFVIPNVTDRPLTVRRYFFSDYGQRQSIKKIIKVGNSLYINTGFGMRAMDLSNYVEGDSVKFTVLPDSKVERIFALAQSDNGEIWYSSIDSFFRTSNNVGITQDQYKGVAFKNFEFFGRYLVGITHDNQLLIYETSGNHAKKHSVRGNCIWENLYKLDSSHMLVSTNGIYHLLTFNTTQQNVPYTLTALEDAFIPLQAEAICIGKNDCYFFKSGNITKIAKNELVGKTAPPLLYFTTIETSKGTYRISGPTKIQNSESGHVAIAFSTVSFGGNALTYQYSMSDDGKDHWVNINGDINLTNPRFGNYTVKVRAKTAASDFSEPITLEFTILRPFWATWWFIASIACIFGTIVWLIVRNRINARIKKKEKEHETHVRFIKSEYKAMNALMNPHFVFNSINNVQSLVNDRDVLNATEYLGVFADLIRQNMHNISNDVIPLQKEIELVENYLVLEKLRFEDKLNYSINIAENAFLTDIMVPPLLLQPLVENSIKHGILPLKNQGRDGHVAINIFEEHDKLFIEVVDNGIGITKARQKRSLHESYGLTNIKNRVQQLSIILGKEMSFELSEVFDDDGTPEGTKAIICIPIG